jgi:hypothetical protein
MGGIDRSWEGSIKYRANFIFVILIAIAVTAVLIIKIKLPTTQNTAVKYWEKRLDGSVRLTSCHPYSCQNPVFSPDNQIIMFTRFLNGYNEGPSEITQLNLKSDREKIIIDAQNDNVNTPYGSWVGKMITWASDRVGDGENIFIATDDGDNLKQITANRDPNQIYIEPVFNPQNINQIIFEIGRTANQPH